ncbi:hypothetical protein [Rhizobium sp. BT03]|nr:hypothetical protein [Rhizobium sp. BT03]WHO76000.1 hypothetical protein QMO80_005106 [Rhizobium sp. BT03]
MPFSPQEAQEGTTAASVQAINEAWMVVAVLTGCSLVCVPFARRLAPR